MAQKKRWVPALAYVAYSATQSRSKPVHAQLRGKTLAILPNHILACKLKALISSKITDNLLRFQSGLHQDRSPFCMISLDFGVGLTWCAGRRLGRATAAPYASSYQTPLAPYANSVPDIASTIRSLSIGHRVAALAQYNRQYRTSHSTRVGRESTWEFSLPPLLSCPPACSPGCSKA
eukprot:1022319-Rhodomonas_salina.2